MHYINLKFTSKYNYNKNIIGITFSRYLLLVVKSKNFDRWLNTQVECYETFPSSIALPEICIVPGVTSTTSSRYLQVVD